MWSLLLLSIYGTRSVRMTMIARPRETEEMVCTAFSGVTGDRDHISKSYTDTDIHTVATRATTGLPGLGMRARRHTGLFCAPAWERGTKIGYLGNKLYIVIVMWVKQQGHGAKFGGSEGPVSGQTRGWQRCVVRGRMPFSHGRGSVVLSYFL